MNAAIISAKPVAARLRWLAGQLYLIVFFIGATVLAGWVFNLPVLTRISPAWPTMKVNTATCFILAAVSFHLMQAQRSTKPNLWFSGVCAGLIMLTGLLTLIQHTFHIDLGIDQWLVKETYAPFPIVLGRMAPITAFNFLLTGTALLALQRRWYKFAQGLAVVVFATAFVGFLGFFYGVEFLSSVATYSAIAFHTTIAFMFSSAAILFAQPEHGIAKTLCVGEGGVIIRRILPFLAGAFLVLGWLHLKGERMGLYSPDFGIALLALANIVILTGVIWGVGRSLNRAGAERNKTAEALAQSEDRLRFATEAAEIGTWKYYPAAKQSEWSEKANIIFGMPPETKITYELFLARVHPDDRKRVDDTIQRCVDPTLHEPYDIDYRILWPDGTVRWINAKGRLSFQKTREQEQALRFSGIVRDITSQKNADEVLHKARSELQHYARELEDRVAERTAKLQATVDSLETFVYTIAHDLRAPLRAMRAFTQALLEDQAPQLDDIGKDFCTRINDAAARMDMLISDLIEYGQLSHNDVPPKWVDLDHEIDTALQKLQNDISDKKAEVNVDKPLPLVCADAALLDQVLVNLVSNALKFVPHGVVPKIHLHAERHDENVRLWVEDNGIGIAAEHHERIFGVFERLHSNNAFPGTGVGLAIAKKAMEQMGGQVGVDSEPNKGSRFWIDLPAPSTCKPAAA